MATDLRSRMSSKSLLIISACIFVVGTLLTRDWVAACFLALQLIAVTTLYLTDRKSLRSAREWTAEPGLPPTFHVGRYEILLQPIYKKIKRNAKIYQKISEFNDEVNALAMRLPAAIIKIDEYDNLLWANYSAVEFFGIDFERDRGASLFNILREPKVADYIRADDFDKPLYFQYRNGEEARDLQLDVTRNTPDHLLLLCHDITKVEQMRRVQQDFVANVSHELRSPLTIINGFLETMHDIPMESITPEKRQKYYQLISEQAQHMLALVTDLLTLSSLESTDLPQSEMLDMDELIHSCVKQAVALSNGAHQFNVKITPSLNVYGSRTELHSAFGNILTNAVRYTPKGGTITVNWSRQGVKKIFCVCDTGPGIHSKDIHRLTERFYRVDKSRSRDTGGTGLGLAITKHVLLRHHAELKISSTLGKGSQFSIEFGPENLQLASRPDEDNADDAVE